MGRLRIALALVLVVLCTPLIIAAESVRTEVLSDSGDVVVVRFEIGAHLTETVLIDGKEYREIELPGEPVFLEAGQPALPHVNRSVIVPDDARMTVKVISSSFTEIPAQIAPSKGNLLRTVDPNTIPYEFGEAYSKNGFFPGPLATIGDPYIMRDHRGLVIQVNPFQYNPVTDTLRVYSEVTVEVSAAGSGQINVLDRGQIAMRPSRAFAEIYRAHFLNHPSGRFYNPIDEEGDMLIICYDEWMPNMQPFVDHKNSIGINTMMVGISTIGNTSTSIKNRIQSVYNNSDLAFVLLVGDIDQITSPYSSGGRSDPSYSKLVGSDSYPEIMVGRFSAETAAHVDTQVERSVTYEVDNYVEEDWFWKGTGIGSAEGAGIGDEGQSDIQHLNEIRGWLMGAGYTEVDQFYEPGASISQVRSALNTGRGIVNYTGHGSTTSWSTTGFNNSNVNQLTNDGKLPFIISVACVNGEFDSYTTCFAETWLRATNNGEPSGAVATYMSSINQSWAPPMEGQDEFNILLSDPSEPYHSFGALCFAGSASMMDAYGGSGTSMFDTWHIFGDPSLRIVGTVIPADWLQVTPETNVATGGLAGGPFGPDRFDFEVTNVGNQVIDFEVTSNAPWLTFNKVSDQLWGGTSTTISATLDEGMRNFDNGVYRTTVEFTNLTNHSGDTAREVEVRIGVPVLKDKWTMDQDPGWSTEGQWQYGQPTGQGGEIYGNPDPTSGATGDMVYGVSLQGDYAARPGPARYLTSPALDVSQLNELKLGYQRWLNMEGPPLALATVEASVVPDQWTLIWENDADVGDSAWMPVTHDLGWLATGHPEISLRWGYVTTNHSAVPCSGWNLDDIELWGVPTSARAHLTVGRVELSWTAVLGAMDYDVVVGDIATLVGSGGDYEAATMGCAAPSVTGTSVEYGAEPDPGDAWFILVRGATAFGSMTFESLAETQVGLRDDEIAASGLSCP